MRKHRWSLTLFYSAIVFAYLLITVCIISVAMWFLSMKEIIYVHEERLPENTTIIIISALLSFTIGFAIAVVTGRFSTSPFHRIVEEATRLASGDFKARLKFSPTIAKLSAFREISESFNKLAEELQNTEILRSDFVNNFAHEFKTPLVSIAGFAELLESENLTEEERLQYVHVIKEEARRLGDMATNVLYLTKLENQNILADKSTYNLSEQIRSAILLLEPKWSSKELELNINFDEHEICANEELLKQVWINLFDNAVKFTPKNGTVSVNIEPLSNGIKVHFSNTGEGIPPEKLGKIFRKFYQSDESHSSQGNGIGLAIVNRIIELHQGSVTVKSEDGLTVFSVFIPH